MSYPDLQEHLHALEEKGLLLRIHHPINKDTEIHPLVRWQFRGGIPESERKAFFFENVVDGHGRHYNMPVVVGALAASPQIYLMGLKPHLKRLATYGTGPFLIPSSRRSSIKLLSTKWC